MFVACECLNVILESNDSHCDFVCVNDENDPFFLKDLSEMISVKVSVQLPKLIQNRQCEQWSICHCDFCNSDVYAFMDSSFSSSVVVEKTRMVDSEQLSLKQKSSNYSPFFKIVIDHNNYVSNISDTQLENYLSLDVLKWLYEQATLTQQRIQSFSDNEYAAFKTLKKRILQESEIVFRKSNVRKSSNVSSTENERRELDLSPLKIELEAISNHPKVNKPVEICLIESEEMIFMDDVDIKEPLTSYQDEMITEDAEEATEDIESFFSQDSPTPISRSLPVPVPQFMKEKKNKDKNMTPEVPCDIAASIEALARSLHGDNIFGDLPPPRFSNAHL